MKIKKLISIILIGLLLLGLGSICYAEEEDPDPWNVTYNM
ncbi:hypothetical protein SAMN02745135_02338 [Caloranaerobacter azorensis DSM 13643]|uniref:Uncharacterized protein n=1 Tax=Caloranaerobacter azorensis DSM 13643 TaxID=1121264 RepID=A0A1M5W831_9FIRM|nr:hypothetical protein SAMN02745135_02338 [Caloranaerobacter azorensis DSM 13643]